jgi:hypothetical protein
VNDRRALWIWGGLGLLTLGGVIAALVALPFKGESGPSGRTAPTSQAEAPPSTVPGGGAAAVTGLRRGHAGKPGHARLNFLEKKPTRIRHPTNIEHVRTPPTPVKPGTRVVPGRPRVPSARIVHPVVPRRGGGPRAATSGAVTLVRNTDLGAGTANRVPEPSVASNGNVVLETWNWYAGVSDNGGASFRYIDPKAAFPSVNGGYCCDQLALYVPGRDIFIWVLQYSEDAAHNNTIRVAVANGGANAVAGNFRYWNLTPQQVGASSGTNYDQPKIAVTNNYLFLEVQQYGARSGAVVMRLPLATLAAGGSLNYQYFLPNLFSPALTVGAAGTMYFAGHVNTSALRVWSWPDSAPDSSGVTAVDVPHSAYPRPSPYSCRHTGAPAGSDWCHERNDDRIIYAWVKNGTIGVIWDAGQGNGGLGTFPYPYEHVVLINETSKARIGEPIIWNSSYAFQYSSVMPNPSGDIGGIVEFGGGSTFENCAILYRPAGGTTWDVTPVENSDADTAVGESGDYLTAHLDGSNPNLWSAGCYALHGSGADTSVHPYYVAFVPSGVTPPPPPPPPPGPPPPPPGGDTTPPRVQALVSTGRRGGTVKLRYTVTDDSGQSADTLRVFRGRAAIARLSTGLGPASSAYVYFVRWHAPRRRGAYRFCVQSRDPSGNVSRPSCARIRLR